MNHVDITDTNIEYDEKGNIKSYKDKDFVYDHLMKYLDPMGTTAYEKFEMSMEDE